MRAAARLAPNVVAFPTTHPTVRFQQPELPPMEEVLGYYGASERAQFFSNGGPCARLLSDRLALRLGGGRTCIPVSSATTGLLVALRGLLGRPEGERRLVITPSFTFTATACAIDWAGFEPLFVDVDPQAWQLDPVALDRALTDHAGRVAGVLGCSTFGCMPPPEVRAAWRATCEPHGVPLLLDSAAAFGAVDAEGRTAGALDEVEVFSFHATKPFAIGEGGMVVVPDGERAERIARLINFGMPQGGAESAESGINAKLSELHAATALAMLDRYDDVLARRRATAARLIERMADLPLTFQRGNPGSTWQFLQVLMPTAAARAAAVEVAAALGVQVRTCFDPPLHRHEAFGSAPRAGELTVTEDLASRALSLPLANDLAEWQVERIALVARDALA